MLPIIDADTYDAYIKSVKIALVLRELTQFSGAKGSPVATVKYQQQAAPATLLRQMKIRAILVLQCKVRSRLVLGRRYLRLGIGHLRQSQCARGKDEGKQDSPPAHRSSLLILEKIAW